MEVGLGKYPDVEAEDGHLDEVDLNTVKEFREIVCQRCC
jgi:hypothetical protein